MVGGPSRPRRTLKWSATHGARKTQPSTRPKKAPIETHPDLATRRRGYLKLSAQPPRPYAPAKAPSLEQIVRDARGPKQYTAMEILQKDSHKELVVRYLHLYADHPARPVDPPGFKDDCARLLGLINSNERLNYEDAAHLVVSTFRAGDLAESMQTKQPILGLDVIERRLNGKLVDGAELDLRERSIAIRSVIAATRRLAAQPDGNPTLNKLAPYVPDLVKTLWEKATLTPEERQLLILVAKGGGAATARPPRP